MSEYPEPVEVAAAHVRVGDSVSFVGTQFVKGVVTRTERPEPSIATLFVQPGVGPEVCGSFRRDDVITRWELSR